MSVTKRGGAFRRLLDSRFGEDAANLIDVLEQLLSHKDARVRLEAVKTALDYQIGKPTQRIDHTGIPETNVPTIVIKTLEMNAAPVVRPSLPVIDVEPPPQLAPPDAPAPERAPVEPVAEPTWPPPDPIPPLPEIAVYRDPYAEAEPLPAPPPPQPPVKRKRGRPPGRRPALGPRSNG